MTSLIQGVSFHLEWAWCKLVTLSPNCDKIWWFSHNIQGVPWQLSAVNKLNHPLHFVSEWKSPRKCYCGLMCLCARVSGTGVSSLGGWAAGRRQAQALCTWSVSGWWPGPGSRPVSPHTQTHAAGTRQFWGDSSIGSISSDQRQEWPEWHQWWDDPLIQSAWGAWCSVKPNYYSCVSWPVQCQS